MQVYGGSVTGYFRLLMLEDGTERDVSRLAVT